MVKRAESWVLEWVVPEVGLGEPEVEHVQSPSAQLAVADWGSQGPQAWETLPQTPPSGREHFQLERVVSTWPTQRGCTRFQLVVFRRQGPLVRVAETALWQLPVALVVEVDSFRV